MDWVSIEVDVRGANALSVESDSGDNRGSVTGPVIEVATIDERHRRKIVLDVLGIYIVLRLGVSPVRLPREVLKRAITVDRISPVSGDDRWEEVREIGWAGLSELVDRCEQLSGLVNQQDIT
jgi:hypothetical protein